MLLQCSFLLFLQGAAVKFQQWNLYNFVLTSRLFVYMLLCHAQERPKPQERTFAIIRGDEFNFGIVILIFFF